MARSALSLCRDERASAEEFELDWNRTGQFDDFESSYTYDTYGQLEQRMPPHPVDDPSPQAYEPAYAHGALVSLKRAYGGEDHYVIKDPGAPGVEYNHAGGVSRIRFGNGVDSVITPNDAFLPEVISLVGASWTTGSYSYDGARNIVGIGSDAYRYDATGRLRRALVTSNDFGSGLVLDYDFDIYGNMLGRTAMLPDGKAPGPVRAGLPIVGQSFAGNRIATSGFSYDENGNLTEEPEHDDVGGFQYSFVPENRMAYVQPLDGDGRFVQEAAYDGSGNRWLLRTWANGGRPLITLRDVTGAVAVEYQAESATSGLEPRKAYAHGAGQLLATTSTCGPAPALSFSTYTASGITVQKKDYATATGAYRLVISNDAGQTNELTPSFTGDFYTIGEGEFFANENNWIRLEATLDCGATGLGNAVSYINKTAASCITRTSISNKNFTDDTSWIDIWGHNVNCAGGLKYRAWYFPEVGSPVLLADNLLAPYLKMPGTPLGAGHGTYAFVEFDPATGQGPLVTGMAINDERNSRGESGEAIGSAAWRRTEYIHVDHLGSTRVVTDDDRAIAAKYKYYPFGLEADTSSGSDVRMKFTGHERDEGVGLDYMKARYMGSWTGRFASVDPVQGGARNPQSWHRYSYVRNNPTRLVDPDGRNPLMATQLQNAFSDSYQQSADAVEAATGAPIGTLNRATQYGIYATGAASVTLLGTAAVTGAAFGGAIEAGKQLVAGEGLSDQDIAANAAAGGIGGAVIKAAQGAGALAQMAAGAAGGALGQGAASLLDTDSSTSPGDGGDLGWAAVGGGAGGLAAAAAEGLGPALVESGRSLLGSSAVRNSLPSLARTAGKQIVSAVRNFFRGDDEEEKE